jgi:hypothetical protein
VRLFSGLVADPDYRDHRYKYFEQEPQDLLPTWVRIAHQIHIIPNNEQNE